MFYKRKNKEKGFSLVEFAIVVGIFGVLVAIALPNGTAVKAEADYGSVAETVHTLETAEAVYEVNNNSLGTIAQMLANGALNTAPLQNLAIGSTSTMAVVAAGTAAGSGGATANGYDLDGDGTVDVGGTTGNSATFSVAEITINGVTANDAFKVGQKIDGSALNSAIGVADSKGRVEYPAIVAPATGIVKIFVARR